MHMLDTCPVAQPSLVILCALRPSSLQCLCPFTKLQKYNFEPYILRPAESDPAVCAARNVHGRTRAEIDAMAYMWEEPPPLYTQLSVVSLLGGSSSSTSQDAKNCGELLSFCLVYQTKLGVKNRSGDWFRLNTLLGRDCFIGCLMLQALTEATD